MEDKFFKEQGNQRASMRYQPTLEAEGSLIHQRKGVCSRFSFWMLDGWKERLVSGALVR